MTRTAVIFLTMLTVPTLAPAQTGPTSSNPAIVTAASSGPSPIICRKEETTGSRLQKQRICHTKAEWEELRIRNMMSVEGRETGLHTELVDPH